MRQGAHTKALLGGIAFSVLAITLATLKGLHPVAAMGLGIAPLVLYHALLCRTKDELAQATIDSVYYFGFLVTVAALGASAIHVATSAGPNSSPDLHIVAFQFGLGLLATGYAVLARIHLTTRAHALGERDPQELLDEYLRKTRDLIGNVELTTSSYKAFADRLKQETEQTVKASFAHVDTSMRDAASAFEGALKVILAEASRGITELRALTSELAFDADRKHLGQAVRQTVKSIAKLTETLGALDGTAASAMGTLGELRQSALQLAGATDKLSQLLGDVSSSNGPVEQYAQSVSHGTDVLREATTKLASLSGELSGMIEAARQTGPEVSGIRDAVREIGPELESLKSATNTFAGVARVVKDSGEAFARAGTESRAVMEGLRGLLDACTVLSNAIHALQQRSQVLGEGMAGLTGRLATTGDVAHQALVEAAARLEGDVQNSTTAVGKLTERMTEMVAYIIERTRERRAT